MTTKKIKRWMDENGISPERLAVMMGVGTGTIRHLLKGQPPVGQPTLRLLAHYMASPDPVEAAAKLENIVSN